MSKTILFVLLAPYADWEAAYLASAVRMFAPDTYTIRTVSLHKGEVESMGGFHTQVDFDLDTMPADYEALVLIGGMSWRTQEARQIQALAVACVQKGKLLGGICDAAGFLATTGILNNVRHTGNGLENLQQWAGEAYTGEKNYIREPAVCDQKIVTANGTAPLEFAREVLLALEAAPDETILEWYNFHKLGMYHAPIPQ